MRVSSIVILILSVSNAMASFIKLGDFQYDDVTGELSYAADNGQSKKIESILLPKNLQGQSFLISEFNSSREGNAAQYVTIYDKQTFQFYVLMQNRKTKDWSVELVDTDTTPSNYKFRPTMIRTFYSEKLKIFVMESYGHNGAWGQKWKSAIDEPGISDEISKFLGKWRLIDKQLEQWSVEREALFEYMFQESFPDLYKKLSDGYEKSKKLAEAKHKNKIGTASEWAENTKDRFAEIPVIAVKNEDNKEVNAWEIIEGFSRDLLEEAVNDHFDDDIDLRKIEDEILKNLLKVEGGSVKLLAPAGVGKSVLIRRLMHRIAKGDVPPKLLKYRFRGASGASLDAGSKYVGAIEARVNALLEVSKKIPIVWFVDEAHTLSGVGVAEGRPANIMQMIKPELATGSLKLILATTPDEWAHAFASDSALDRRFTRVDLTEPTPKRTLKIAKSWIVKHGLEPISDKLLMKVIQFSNEFGVEGAQPSRATKLLTELYAEQSFNGKTKISIKDVYAAAKSLYGVDPAEFEQEKMHERYQKLSESLKQLAGQDVAKQAILNIAKQNLTGAADKSKPRYRLVFAGPKGQGKTEIVKLFAKSMGLPEENRIVMSEYSSPDQIDELKANIAKLVRRNPFTVLFFDEFEKSHPAIQKALLGALDSGLMTYSSREGTSIKFSTIQIKNTSVFISTNAGEKYIQSLQHSSGKSAVGFHSHSFEPVAFDSSMFRRALVMDGIDEYVLDRTENVIPFFYLNRDEFSQVLRIHITKTIEDIEASSGKKISLQNYENMIEALTRMHFSPTSSSRDILRVVNENLRQSIANLLFEDRSAKVINLIWDKNQILNKKTNSLKMINCRSLFQ